MSNRQKVCTFLFMSGNSCDVLIDWKKIKTDPLTAIKVEWDRFPPSPEDCKLWSREYFPETCRRLAELLPGGPTKIAAVDRYGRVMRIDRENQA